jgi:hypothetical protein
LTVRSQGQYQIFKTRLQLQVEVLWMERISRLPCQATGHKDDRMIGAIYRTISSEDSSLRVFERPS